MPAGPGEDAERFADAVELGRPRSSAGAGELAQELEIVAMLRYCGASAAAQPDPVAKAHARQRLMAVLARQAGEGGPPAAAASVGVGETVRLGRLLQPAFPPATVGSEAGGSEAVGSEGGTDQFGPPAGPADPDVEPALVGTGSAAGRPGRRGRHSLPSRPAGRPGTSRGSTSRAVRRRFAFVGSAALVLAMALAGAGLLVSSDAVPGDSLYAVKRVAESAGVALTLDDAGKAHRHLALATTRLDEVEKLVHEDPRAADPRLVTSALREFDDSTGLGSRALLAVHGGNAEVGEELRAWASEQWARLAALQPALPADSGATDTLALLDRLVGRTRALEDPACTGVPRDVDDLGPVPAGGSCAGGTDAVAGSPPGSPPGSGTTPTEPVAPSATGGSEVVPVPDPVDPPVAVDPTPTGPSGSRTTDPRTSGAEPDEDDDPDRPRNTTRNDDEDDGEDRTTPPRSSSSSDDGNRESDEQSSLDRPSPDTSRLPELDL